MKGFKQSLVGVGIGLALSITPTLGHAAVGGDGHDGQWTRFHAHGPARIYTVIVATLCLNAEDSAAHLRLRQYNPITHRAKYDCKKGGY